MPTSGREQATQALRVANWLRAAMAPPASPSEAMSIDTLGLLSPECDKRAISMAAKSRDWLAQAVVPQFLGNFFKKQAIDWPLIKHSTPLLDTGGGLLKNLLKRTDCPVSLLSWAVENIEAQQNLAVAINAQTPEGLLRKLAADGEVANRSRSLSIPVARAVKQAAEADRGHSILTKQAAFADLDQKPLGCLNSHRVQPDHAVEPHRGSARRPPPTRSASGQLRLCAGNGRPIGRHLTGRVVSNLKIESPWFGGAALQT